MGLSHVVPRMLGRAAVEPAAGGTLPSSGGTSCAPSCSQHKTSRVPDASWSVSTGGSCDAQISMAQAQRGWKGHPEGTLHRSRGEPSMPVIVFLSPCNDGKDLVSP